MIDTIPGELHDPRPFLKVQGLLRQIPEHFRPRRDVKLLVLDEDVTQVQLPLRRPCNEVITALLRGRQELAALVI